MSVIDPRIQRWRHGLHRIPETAFAEHRTSAYIAEVLNGLGYDVTTHVGRTGLVASLRRGTSTRAVGLRSELDALPISEATGLAYASQHPGVMHACGHDGHMAMLLGAAARLAGGDDDGFDGTVRLIFQPAEEPGRGARAMIDDGLLQRFPVDSIYALHNAPGLPAGHLHTRSGPIMASEDNFTIRVTGRGGHASAPHLVVDPLVVAAEIVLALQHVVARSVDPIRTAVLSCTDLVTDGARNAIPTHVTITGDTRSFDPTVQATLERRIREISHGITAAHSAHADVTYTHEFAPTVNHPSCVALVERASVTALGAASVDTHADPMMASEDFGLLAEEVPGCMVFIGNGIRSTPLHSHDYLFDDGVLDTGVSFLVRTARLALA